MANNNKKDNGIKDPQVLDNPAVPPTDTDKDTDKDKVTDKDTDRETVFSKLIKTISKWRKYIGWAFLLAGAVLLYFGMRDTSESNEDQQSVNPQMTDVELAKVLESKSNYSSVIQKWDFDDFWPKEYFEINLKDKTISYHGDQANVVKVEYQNCVKNSKNNNLKDFKDDENKQTFSADFPEIKNLESLVEKDFLDAIDAASIDDDDTKNLCLLYNALAGHRGSYILLGSNNENNGNWKYYTPDDFPKYKLDIDYSALRNVLNSGNKTDSFLRKNIKVSEISVKALSLDYRGNKIWYGNDSCGASKSEIPNLIAPYDYEKLSGESACGWIVPDNEKKPVEALDYYKQDIVFLYENPELDELKWNEQENGLPFNKYMKILGIVLSIVGVAILLYSFFPQLRRFVKKYKEVNGVVAGSGTTESEAGKSPEADLKEEISLLRKALKDKEKELEEKLEKREKDAIKEYKESEEFKNTIKKARKNAVEEFKGTKEYDDLKTYSKCWNEFCGSTKESKVLEYLRKINAQKESFPVPRTLVDIYTSVSDKTEEAKEQIREFLIALQEQVGSGKELKSLYDTLVKDAEYANEVRGRFEACKKISENYGERKEYKQIASQKKTLTIWERVAVMLWAMECTNELLKAFGKSHFTPEIVRDATEVHKEDIMQVFATRIFRKFVGDTKATEGELANSRDKMMKEKLLEMHGKYGITMAETKEYQDFVKDLDSIYDRIKREAAFIHIMKDELVDEFARTEREIKDEGQYLSLLVAMGLHLSDFVRYMSGNKIEYCHNLRFALSGMNTAQLDGNTEFRHKDPAYSGDYANRVYEWLKAAGVKHLKALVGNRLIMP